MLRKSTGAGALVLVALLTSTAIGHAADLPSRLEPVAPSLAGLATPGSAIWPSWTGFYAGLSAGYDLWRKDAVKPNGAQVGVRIGYDYELSNNLVFGALIGADLNFGNKTIANANTTIKTKQVYTATADVRLGYAINSFNLAYAMVGLTRVQIEQKLISGGATGVGSAGRNGLNLGAGYEYRFSDNFSGFAEARYHRVAISGARPSFIDLKLGVNYRL